MKGLCESEIKKLRGLEESLWKSKTRFNLEFQEKYFAADFFEFGRSGRRYKRDEMIREDSYEIKAELPLESFEVHLIDDHTVLITYVSKVQYDELEVANRSSLWTKYPDGWKLRFHQGTPIYKK